MRIKNWIVGALLAFGSIAAPAFAWSDNNWTYRKEVTLDTTPSGASVSGNLRGFAVLIRLDSSNFTFDDAKPDGSDIRFYAADDKTALPFRIERFDAKTGLAAIWVGVADLPGSSQTKIYMYFGNKKAGVAPVSGPVFDPLYKAVYHFGANEKTPLDDSGNRNDALSPVATKSGGWIGADAKLDGTSAIALPTNIAVNAAQGFTFEAWVKPRDAATGGIVYANGNLTIGIDKGLPYVEVAGQRAAATTALTGDWTYLAVTVNGNAVTLYVNGLPAATLSVGTPLLSGGGALAGSPTFSGSKFAGEIDEVRLSAGARTAAYVKAAYGTEGAGSHLAHLGATEQPADAGFGYFGVIFKSVTPDAWAIIAILMAMGVLSWIVMWRKSGYASRTGRANHAFMTYYRNLNGNLLTLEETNNLDPRDLNELSHSSLYRLYKVGAHELSVRLERLAGAPLAEENLEAIRATLDATLVDETRKLDKNMVLLTIAIAGAPFIGLLGTVLGVMITFASIAAAGEVNVNAIAPGIAAALLATVAGLAVAIPALFGYNYILSRNNTVAAETQIFGDQLLTRFAEWQRHVQRTRHSAAAE